MKCTKCGADIKKGNLYCSKCGEEVQIVSAYNVMEDEFFLDFQNETLDDEEPETMSEGFLALQKKKLYISILCAFIGFLTLLIPPFLTRMHSGAAEVKPDRYKEFLCALSEADDKRAEECLNLALEETPEELSGYFWLAWLYGKQGAGEQQIETLRHILSLDKENIYACKELIEAYVRAGDFETLHELTEDYSDSRLAALFSEYSVEAPVAQLESESTRPGDVLTITAAEGLNIYYTLDDTSPITNGTLYYAPIYLEAGSYTLQAASCNEKGYYSPVISEQFTVETVYNLEMPRVTPDSGEFLVPQTIYVNVPEGCSAYYTWDGSEPTIYSKKYNGGISMPVGNNVLSVILVDEYGNTSSVQRVNYIYMP